MARGGSRLCLLAVLLGPIRAGDAMAQCMLANPSFELPGSGGAVFAGWNQFGVIGVSAEATHGAQAARVSGPGPGTMSAFWQRLDSVPGDRWSASVEVRVSATTPLTGASQAIVNVEWRDASGALIDYESHPVADAGTPVDMFRSVSVVSQSAPAGTAATHLLVGVLQAPGEPVADVFYDQVTFEELGPPTPDDRQWLDFPGGRTLDFSGRSWRVKGPGFYGPGPNLFCDTADCAWVDGSDRLHLTIRNIAGSWYSSEVALEEAVGYGDYVFTTLGRLDDLDLRTVFGLFLWEYGACYDPGLGWWNPYNEIDVEFSRWGSAGNDVGNYVVQPYDFPGNRQSFDATFGPGEVTSHAFRWLPDRVEWRSWRGGPQDESSGNLIHSWTYTGWHLPRPEQPRVHLNLWQFEGPPATEQEVVLDAFTFIPMTGPVDAPIASRDGLVTRHATAHPNPFRSGTTIRYAVPRAATTEIAIHDVAGRLVRRLGGQAVPAGSHETTWDGRDDAGRPVVSGVYLYRFRAGSIVETHRVVRVR